MKIPLNVAKQLFVLVAISFSSTVFIPLPVSAGELQSSIARGGRLYDNWFEEIREHAPSRTHPAYPASGGQSADAKTNWRCKECHGWDYRGRDGAYGEGKHATGMKFFGQAAETLCLIERTILLMKQLAG